MAVDSMAKASSHSKIGPGPLWHTPGLQLPAYIQHIAKALIAKGMEEGHAIATAKNTCERWAAGGGNVDANTQAAARKALAEWEAAKAKAHSTTDKSKSMAAPVRRAVELVGPKGYSHGWIKADGSTDHGKLADHLSASTPGKAKTVISGLKDHQLSGVDHEMSKRASALGRTGAVSKAHALVKAARKTKSMTAPARRTLNLAFTESMHPRVAKGGTGGGQFTKGDAKPGANANGAGTKTGSAGADNAAVDALAKMENMTPAQRQAFLATLSGAELQALGGYLTRNPPVAGDAGQAANAAAVAGALKAHGLNPDGSMPGGAKKKAGAKKAAGKKAAGGKKSSSGGGGKKSSGGSSGGKSSGGSSGSSKSSGSSAAAKAAAQKKAAAAQTAAQKKAAAAVAKAAAAKAAADKKAAAAATAAQKKAAAAAVKAAAAAAKQAAADKKIADAAAAAAAKAAAPKYSSPRSARIAPVVKASYTDRIVLDLASAPNPGNAVKKKMAENGQALPNGSFRIPTVAFLRKAVMSYGRCPAPDRPALANLIRKRARELNAIDLPWVQSFLKTVAGDSSDSADSKPATGSDSKPNPFAKKADSGAKPNPFAKASA